jgi:photosystem II stability/assembly factor-like uncharacterized protein
MCLQRLKSGLPPLERQKGEKMSKKVRFLRGAFAITLVLGMTVVGCEQPEEDDDDGPSNKPKGSVEQVVKPTADPDGGNVLSGRKITLTSTTSGTAIYYTLDGTTPTTSSTSYNSSTPEITSSCTLKAIATKSGMTDSEVLSVSYTAVAMPAFSPVTSTVALFNYGINAVAYGNNRFVAVGNGGIAYSSNGTTWTKPTGNNADFVAYGITYGTQFFAVGVSGTICYSSDGTSSWNPVGDSTFGSSNIRDIAYGGGRYVAVGDSGKIATSTNGTTWTAITNSTFGTTAIYGITYGDSKFVAVGAEGKMAYSINGTTWTAVTNSSTTAINGITYGGAIGKEKFIAVGSSTYIAYSTDGVTWTKVNSGYYSVGLKEIVWGGNKYVAVASAGVMLVSLDGINNWSRIEGGIGSGKSQMDDTDAILFVSSINGIAYGGGKFLAVGSKSTDLGASTGEMAISN